MTSCCNSIAQVINYYKEDSCRWGGAFFSPVILICKSRMWDLFLWGLTSRVYSYYPWECFGYCLHIVEWFHLFYSERNNSCIIILTQRRSTKPKGQVTKRRPNNTPCRSHTWMWMKFWITVVKSAGLMCGVNWWRLGSGQCVILQAAKGRNVG